MTASAVGRIILVVGAVWACSDSPSAPYYLYNGTAIPLAIDASRMTIEAESSLVPQLARNAGLVVDSITSLLAAPQHWIVWLAAGTSTGTADYAAMRLRLTPSVSFASTAYVTADGCALELVNRLAIEFKAGVTTAQIQELIDQLHTSGRADPYALGTWILQYPRGMTEPPLQLANNLYQNPLVVFADPDRVDACPGVDF